jgi:hypothetical protein
MVTTISPEHRLWRGHGAANPEQLGLFAEGDRKVTQADRLLAKLREARANRTPLALPSIMQLGIAQHGARLRELRLRGFRIVNRMERVDGAVHSDYELIFDPEHDAAGVEP